MDYDMASRILVLILVMLIFVRGVMMRLTKKELYGYFAVMAIAAFLALLKSDGLAVAFLGGGAFLALPFVVALIVHLVKKIVWAKIRRQCGLPSDSPMP
jgi:hypothetical protein